MLKCMSESVLLWYVGGILTSIHRVGFLIVFLCVWCILGCKNIEMHVSESVLLWCMRCFFRSIVNRFPGLSNAFVVGVTLV